MIPVEYIDYQKCHDYAKTLGGEYGIPRCDWDDIGSDAFLLAIRRSWRTGETANPEAAANRLMYTSVLNVINRRNTHASKIIRKAADIDAMNADSSDAAPTLRTEDDEAVDDARSGEALARAPTIGVNITDDWRNPLWLRLFNLERQKLRNERRRSPLADVSAKVIKAGLKDSRLCLAKADLKISGPRFRTILKFLRTRFDLCYHALRTSRA